MKTAHIEIQVLSDSIGSEWNDIDVAGEAYAQHLNGLLVEALAANGFSTNDINVTYHANLAGYARKFVSADDCDDEQALEEILDSVTDEAWDSFCNDDRNIAL